MGRPTTYSKQLADITLNLYREGKTDAQVAGIIDVSEKTLYNWRQENPEYLLAIRDIKDLDDMQVETALRAAAVGYTAIEERVYISFGKEIRVKVPKHYPPDIRAAMFWLKNRHPDKWREHSSVEKVEGEIRDSRFANQRSFEEFCTIASYNAPYPKQVEMRKFGIDSQGSRMILGSRGYGKTDYVVILGVAYKLYLNQAFTVLLVTKSRERNAAMLKEISNACKANGMAFEKENSNSLRVAGLKGKDHSVSAVTIKTVTLRGRHPKLVIMDDPVTEDDVSEATRMHVKRVYNEINKLCPDILIIGQPAHKYDLYADLRGLLKTMEVPHGTIPELDHDLEAQRLAGVDEASIQASYFLKVMSEGTTPFDNVKYIDKFPIGDTAVAFIDPSFEGGDYTAMSIIHAYGQGVAVVGFTFKKAWNHCLDEIAPILTRFKVKKLCFETNSLGDQPLEILRKIFVNVGVQGRKSNTNKHSRIMAAGSFAHMIHLSRESDKIYLDQVVKYEYNANNDDAPDSLASCLQWIGLVRGKL